MPLAPGTLLGPYRVDALLGAGGMGEVYRATDPRVPRAVAIKVLPADVSADPAMRGRFERETRAIGSLSHPNVCTLYDVGEHAGQSFLVMELVEGDTLAKRLERGALPVDEALRHAIEMAGGLDRAHRAGIVHRDLKPANVMITKTGVKLLDFGLAKFKTAPASHESALPTLLSDRTAEGTILGTLQYMSPEQLEGREADSRSDIFAFGAVLYEMITGRKAFDGKSQASVIGAILRDQPPAMTTTQPLAPATLERVVRTCLEKDPDDRFQSAADVARELKWIADELRHGSSGAVAQQAERARQATPGVGRWLWIAATAALVAVAASLGWWLRGSPPELPRWELTRLTADAGLSDYAALSPDGKLVAYSSDRSADGEFDLYVKQVAGGQPIRLTSDGAGNTMPDFSPDGSKIAFRSDRDGGGVYIMPALGGDVRLLVRGGVDPRFSPDGSRVAYWVGNEGVGTVVPGNGTVWVIALSGGSPQRIGANFTSARHPVWSPDGTHVLLLGYTSSEAFQESGLDWFFVPVDGGEPVKTGAYAALVRRELTAAIPLTGPGAGLALNVFPAPLCWSAADDNVAFSASAAGDRNDLWTVGISPRTGMVTGHVSRLMTSASGQAHPSCTPAGAVAFTDQDVRRDVWSIGIDLDRGTPKGALQRVTLGPASRENLALSKNGRYMAFSSTQSGWRNIWIRDLATGKESVVASSSIPQNYPVSDAAGARIAFSAYEAKRVVYVAAPGGVPEKLCDGCLRATDWSLDEKSLLTFGGTPYEINVVDLASRRATLLLKHPMYSLLYGRYSPDGRWISFTVRTDPARAHIAIAPLDGPKPVPESAWITIAESGLEDWANWSPDGQTLYYTSMRDGHSCLWAQRLSAADHRPVGDAFPVLHLHGRVTYQRSGWSAAGGRIAMVLLEQTGNIWMMSRSKEQ